MTTDQLINLDLFSSLSPQEVLRVRRLMEERQLPADTVLFEEGAEGRHMYVVLSGTIAVSITTDDGEKVEVSRIEEGSFFGEMSILEKDVRSATCRTVDECSLLSLDADGFRSLMEDEPETAIKIMRRMLNTASTRLQKTGAFLSDMVKWGEGARIRAVTDDFTGLYNRRFFDEALKESVGEAGGGSRKFSLVMIDLDRFGTLNAEYGEEIGDKVILSIVPIFRETFGPGAILARYGGDEFAFILNDRDGADALNLCRAAGDAVRKLDILNGLGGSFSHVSLSIGIAECPAHGDTPQVILEKADTALYAAKGAGRDRAALYGAGGPELRKAAIPNRRKKLAAVDALISGIAAGKSFLMAAHAAPDEDCVASMVAFGLLLAKFGKPSAVIISKDYWSKFSYLLKICKYNTIKIIGSAEEVAGDYDTIVICDTPKPAMLEYKDGVQTLMQRENVLVMEIDHHLGADGEYIGDEGFRLVDAASSTCELICYLANRLSRKKSLLRSHQTGGLFTRNFVLAVATGFVGDSKMGQFLKTRREKRFFRRHANLFNKMLIKKTRANSGNFASIQDIYNEAGKLSSDEENCFNAFCDKKRNRPSISWIALDEETTAPLFRAYDPDVVVTVAKHAANVLADESGFVSLVAYYDSDGVIQLRMRRSLDYKEFDLREVIAKLGIENGGGHEGAVGFRVKKDQVPDYGAFIDDVIRGTLELMGKA